jgi:hypothetical protein
MVTYSVTKGFKPFAPSYNNVFNVKIGKFKVKLTLNNTMENLFSRDTVTLLTQTEVIHFLICTHFEHMHE